jgi:hypothetical protein
MALAPCFFVPLVDHCRPHALVRIVDRVQMRPQKLSFAVLSCAVHMHQAGVEAALAGGRSVGCMHDARTTVIAT